MTRPNPDGFTSLLKQICGNIRSNFGDPPCWQLPEMVSPCEQITPCDECLDLSAKEKDDTP